MVICRLSGRLDPGDKTGREEEKEKERKQTDWNEKRPLLNGAIGLEPQGDMKKKKKSEHVILIKLVQ